MLITSDKIVLKPFSRACSRGYVFISVSDVFLAIS